MRGSADIFRIRLGSRLHVLVSTVLVSSFILACAHDAPVPPPDVVPGERNPYVIGVMDALGIAVWKNAELTITASVRPDGKISVPLLDDVQAEGLTPEELKEVITEALSEFISTPDVTVMVQQMNSQTVFMLGEGIARSGALSLRSELRVLEAIATMGGFTVWADKNHVRILRQSHGGIVEHVFNYGAYLAGKAPGSNIVLKAGDTIVVDN